MNYKKSDYYAECVECAADELGLKLTPEQIKYIGGAVENYAENVGLAFYEPPASDFYSRKEREWESKYKSLEAEFFRYRDNAETAVKIALRQPRDANIDIGENGVVRKYDGRSDRIQ